MSRAIFLALAAAALVAILVIPATKAVQCTKYKECISCVSHSCIWYTLSRFDGFCDNPSIHPHIYEFKAARTSSCARVNHMHEMDAPPPPPAAAAPEGPEESSVLPLVSMEDVPEPVALPSVKQRETNNVYTVEDGLVVHLCQIYAITHKRVSHKTHDQKKIFRKCMRRWAASAV